MKFTDVDVVKLLTKVPLKLLAVESSALNFVNAGLPLAAQVTVKEVNWTLLQGEPTEVGVLASVADETDEDQALELPETRLFTLP